VHSLTAAAQDHRIARHQPQRGGIGGHIGAAFIDDADDAERDAHAGQRHAVGAHGPVDFGADRVGQGGDGLDRVGNRGEPILVEAQPVEHRRRQAAFASRLHIARIGIQDRRAAHAQLGRSRAQRLGLFGCRRHRERLRCQACARAHVGDQRIGIVQARRVAEGEGGFSVHATGQYHFWRDSRKPRCTRSFTPLVRAHERGHRSIRGGDHGGACGRRD
jgi:hypothetical protein